MISEAPALPALFALLFGLTAGAVRATDLPPAPAAAADPAAQTPANDPAKAPANRVQANPAEATLTSAKPGEAYSLPFLGAAAIAAGATLPLPIGVSIIGQYQREDLRAHNLQVGLGGQPLVDADFVGFNGLTTRVDNLLFRGDLWLFPFLNIYGLAGHSWSNTTTTINRPTIPLVIPTVSDGATYGFGGTLAYGIEPFGFITLDANLTWADQDILSTPQRTFTLTPRVGHRWLSETHPGRAFSLWVGASMEEFENQAQGFVPLGGVLPTGGGTGLLGVLPADYGAWVNTLTPLQKANLNSLLSEALQSDLSNPATRAQFALNVNPSKAWNLVIGGEYDFNNHWQFIAEAGLLGSRTSAMGNLCYRFGI